MRAEKVKQNCSPKTMQVIDASEKEKRERRKSGIYGWL
jgi:hypothetical protein